MWIITRYKVLRIAGSGKFNRRKDLPFKEGLKKPFLQKSKPVNTGAPARFLSKKMGFFRGYLSRFLSVYH
ncbi:hypothetical protein F4W70_26350 [Pseudomonas cannabina]|nr:hypothetical protein F4W70_26350 [Pseudomonas cannabina]